MLKLKIGAEAYTLTVDLPDGSQVYDLSHMNANQLSGVREMVVNYWCRENGHAPLFPG